VKDETVLNVRECRDESSLFLACRAPLALRARCASRAFLAFPACLARGGA